MFGAQNAFVNSKDTKNHKRCQFIFIFFFCGKRLIVSEKYEKMGISDYYEYNAS